MELGFDISRGELNMSSQREQNEIMFNMGRDLTQSIHDIIGKQVGKPIQLNTFLLALIGSIKPNLAELIKLFPPEYYGDAINEVDTNFSHPIAVYLREEFKLKNE